MIVSRPNPNALFALSVFIVISMAIAFMGLQTPIETGVWLWYHYIAVYFFGVLAVLLSFRILYKFKVIYVQKGKFEVWFPFRFNRKKWDIKEVEFWREERVKTGKTVFRELEISFAGKSVKISHQENTSYDKIISYLQKKAAKKRND